MKLMKFIAVPVLALSFFAAGAVAVQAASWVSLFEESGSFVTGLDHYDDNTGAFVKTNAGGTSTAVLVTEDGWATVSASDPASQVYNDIEFIDSDSLIVVGENGTVYKSDNLGSSWSKASILGSYDFNRVEMYDETTGWIVGDAGVVYKTNDGGGSWTPQNSGVSTNLYGVFFLNSSTGYIAGENGTFLLTINGGSSWTNSTVAMEFEEYMDVYFYDISNGFIASTGGLLETGDAGASWDAVSGVAESLSTLDFSSSSVGAVTGVNVLYTTGDSGSSWTSVDLPSETGNYISYDVEMSDAIKLAGYYSAEGSAYLYIQDTQAPSAVSNLSADSPTSSSSTISWTAATDNVAVDSYEMNLDGGSFAMIGDETMDEITVSESEGSHEFGVRAVDEAGNEGEATYITIVFDSTAPVVSTVSPISATEDEAVTLSATVTDNLSDITCDLYLNSVNQGAMTNSSGDTFSKSYTFTADGTYSAYVICEDAAGNSATGSTSSITVEDAPEETTETTETETGDTDHGTGLITDIVDLDTEILIKSQCVGETDVNDPCRAVYYYDTDGYRHAFPNAKVYFTWYDSFDDVVVITSDIMAQAPLGSNVTYHPGKRMVKFMTVNTVYAVAQGGELRAIASEDVAIDLYGSDWNQQIDDISDAFFTNYSFGDDIDSASDYDVTDAIDSVSSLEDNF